MSDVSYPPEYVYVARMGDFVKIGRSQSVRKRLRQLETCQPGTLVPDGAIGHPVTLVGTFECVFGGASALERALHDAFAEQRDVGEWFRVDERLKTWCAGRSAGFWWDGERDYDDLPPVDF